MKLKKSQYLYDLYANINFKGKDEEEDCASAQFLTD